MEANNDIEREAKLEVMAAATLRELISKVNAAGVGKGDVVSVMREDGTYLLLYYRM